MRTVLIVDDDELVRRGLAEGLEAAGGHPHGFALGRMARLHQPKLPLVFISGYPDLAEADEPPEGCQVLLKPVRAQEIIELLEGDLRNEGAQEGVASEPASAAGN